MVFPDRHTYLEKTIKTPLTKNDVSLLLTTCNFFQGSEPTAFSILTSSINGQQFGWDAGDGCDTCWEAGAKNKCSKCQMVGRGLHKVQCALLES